MKFVPNLCSGIQFFVITQKKFDFEY